jgi:tetratricopeptide (TPR) repeat protein
MTVNHSILSTLRRWAVGAFAVALLATMSVPALAQSNGGQQQKLENLKSAYAAGVQAAKQNNASTAYQKLEEALQLANETDQGGAAQKIQQYLSQLPKQWGNKALKNKSYEDALTHFNKGLEHSPEMPYMHYGKGLALINQDQEEAAMQSLTQAMTLGQEKGDMRTANLAENRIRDHYVAQASQVLSSQNPTVSQADEALGYLETMRQYVDPDARAFFYEATALFTKDQLDQAISTAEQGLEMHQGSRSDAAKYHFVIGEAQRKLGNMEAACAQFEQANYGDYSSRAEHYLENECQ